MTFFFPFSPSALSVSRCAGGSAAVEHTNVPTGRTTRSAAAIYSTWPALPPDDDPLRDSAVRISGGFLALGVVGIDEPDPCDPHGIPRPGVSA